MVSSSTLDLPQQRSLMMRVLRRLRGGSREVEVTARVPTAHATGGHHRSTGVGRVAHARGSGGGGGRVARLRRRGTPWTRGLPAGTLRTLLPRVEALADGGVCEWRG